MSSVTLPEPAVADTRAGRSRPARGRFAFAAGWAVRFVVGSLLCANLVTSLVVAGWLARRMRGRAIRHWWEHSLAGRRGDPFDAADYDDHSDPPTDRPRFFVREQARAWLGRPDGRGNPPGLLRRLGRLIRLPVGSLVDNLVAGTRLVVGTAFLMGWGVILIWLGWEFGWHNSFHKGYEQAGFGVGLSLIGFALFAVAMIYVPMAQAHIAATGEVRSALDFRFLRRLIRAKTGPYVLWVSAAGLLSLPLLVMRVMPRFFDQIDGRFETASDAELASFMRSYVLAQAAVAFAFLIVLRAWLARIYAAGVLESLRSGDLGRHELHPAIRSWMDRFGVEVALKPRRAGVIGAAGAGSRWVGRRFAYAFIVFFWLAYLLGVMVAEFFNYHPAVGFLNHTLILLPCPDQVPAGLG